MNIGGIVVAAAISLTSKQNYDIPKDNYHDKVNAPISLLEKKNAPSWEFLKDILDDNADSIAIRREDYRTLDSLLTEAKRIVESNLKIPIYYNNEHIDSVLNIKTDSLADLAANRPMINQEKLVNSILDTITNYTEVVNKYLVKSSIREESRYKMMAHNKYSGASGFGQFTLDGWTTYGEGPFFPNVYNPVLNVRAIIKYYTWMEDEFSKAYPHWGELTIAEKRDYLSSAFNGGPYLYIDPLNIYHKDWNIKNMPKQSQNHTVKVDNAMFELSLEDLSKNIALYSAKIERYESKRNDIFWQAYAAANTKSFMETHILASNSRAQNREYLAAINKSSSANNPKAGNYINNKTSIKTSS